MATYDDLKNLQTQLIRKAQGGSAFIAPASADHIDVDDPFTYTAGSAGPPVVPETIEWADLPAGFEDAGYLTDDGLGFENETSQSDVSSWQSVSPTRSDMLTDTDTLQIVMQETKLLSIGLYLGVDTAGVAPETDTGTVVIHKPTRPSDHRYHVLAVAVDGSGANEIFIARYMPNAKVTGKVGQRYGKGDDPISWGVTFTAYEDNTLGFASTYIFGGRGWKALLSDMGFSA